MARREKGMSPNVAMYIVSERQYEMYGCIPHNMGNTPIHFILSLRYNVHCHTSYSNILCYCMGNIRLRGGV